MLREQVLQALYAYKAKVLANKKNQLTNSEREFFELVSGNLVSIPPREQDILDVNMKRLNRWVDSLQQEKNKILQKFAQMNFNEDEESVSYHLSATYLAYSSLCKMCRHFVTALSNASSKMGPPTIEEV